MLKADVIVPFIEDKNYKPKIIQRPAPRMKTANSLRRPLPFLFQKKIRGRMKRKHC
jgi:hypothetical protein